uniref:Uncharacterized protein n=1 Tax=Pithovirus LCDPAC01 TaxID=2506600 RepID=A0A481YN80_9VIRU|nr:MAG: hypothetical protein LCDPAC01_02190 [Pithovirus LCDPAC01]
MLLDNNSSINVVELGSTPASFINYMKWSEHVTKFKMAGPIGPIGFYEIIKLIALNNVLTDLEIGEIETLWAVDDFIRVLNHNNTLTHIKMNIINAESGDQIDLTREIGNLVSRNSGR